MQPNQTHNESRIRISFCISFFSFCIILIYLGITSPLLAQGNTACTAMAVTPGSYIANGPSSGNGARNGCEFTGATHGDWYKYTAPFDGMITVGSCGNFINTRLSIFSGVCSGIPGSLIFTGNCLESNDNGCGLLQFASKIEDFAVSQGSTYYIQWDNKWSNSGFNWTLDFTTDPPVNDMPCDATNLFCGYMESGTTYGATFSGILLSTCNFGPLPDVFYTLPYPLPGVTYTVEVFADNDMDAIIQTSTGGLCGGPFNPIGCTDDFGQGGDEILSFTAGIGFDPIHIRVNDYNPNGGNFEIIVNCFADECEDAIILFPSSITPYFTNVGALSGSNDFICSSSAANHDVWFKFTAPSTGRVAIETHYASLSDTKMQIWDGCPAGGEIVACDDDNGHTTLSLIVLECGGYIPNHTYYVQVDAASNETGTFGITFTVDDDCSVPLNDFCIDATPVIINSPPIRANNTAASGSPEIDINCAVMNENVSDNDVWFSFIAPSSGKITIETFEFQLSNSQMQVFDACGGDLIACNDDISNSDFMSKIILPCDSYLPGNTYMVQVDGWNGASGAFDISVTTSACSPPPNDNCGNASPIIVYDHGNCPGNESIGTTSGATPDLILNNCGLLNPTVSYSFNSGNNTSIIVNLEGITATELVLSISESCLSNVLYCEDNASPNNIAVLPETDYILRVSTAFGSGNRGTFSVCIESGSYDCAELDANFGDDCDDLDPTTVDDSITIDCTCEGSSVHGGSLSGIVSGWNSGCAARPVLITLSDYIIEGSYNNLPGTLFSDGSFTLDDSPYIFPGTYSIMIKVEGGLSKLINGVEINSGSDTSVIVPQVGLGDLNNDNKINVFDISQFTLSYGFSAGAANYNPLADFNCDGNINLFDISVLSTGYGFQGDSWD